MSWLIDVPVHRIVASIELSVGKPSRALGVEVGSIAVGRRAISHCGRFVPVNSSCGFEPEFVPGVNGLW